MPDEGDNTTELEGRCGVDGTCIDPKLSDCRTLQECNVSTSMKIGAVRDLPMRKSATTTVCKPLMLTTSRQT